VVRDRAGDLLGRGGRARPAMTPATAVRDLEPADAEARDAIVASLPYHFAVETGVRACAAAVRAGPGLVAVEAGVVAGFLTGRAWYETAREITWMAGAADRRGHGIGRALIERLSADSQVHARHLVVTTLSASTPEPGVADG